MKRADFYELVHVRALQTFFFLQAVYLGSTLHPGLPRFDSTLRPVCGARGAPARPAALAGCCAAAASSTCKDLVSHTMWFQARLYRYFRVLLGPEIDLARADAMRDAWWVTCRYGGRSTGGIWCSEIPSPNTTVFSVLWLPSVALWGSLVLPYTLLVR